MLDQIRQFAHFQRTRGRLLALLLRTIDCHLLEGLQRCYPISRTDHLPSSEKAVDGGANHEHLVERDDDDIGKICLD